MVSCVKCGGTHATARVVPEYNADILGAPFKVILRDSVTVEECSACGGVVSTSIPDLDYLFWSVAFARALHPRRLQGPEIKFIRQSMRMKSKKLAEVLGISPEHMSRFERGDAHMPIATEKLLRLHAALGIGDDEHVVSAEIEAKVNEAVRKAFKEVTSAFKRMKLAPVWSSDEQLTFVLEHRRPTQIQGGCDGIWEREPAAA